MVYIKYQLYRQIALLQQHKKELQKKKKFKVYIKQHKSQSRIYFTLNVLRSQWTYYSKTNFLNMGDFIL